MAKVWMAVLLGIVGGAARAEAWGPAELEESVRAALRQMRVEVGEGPYQSVVEITVKMRRQRNSANVQMVWERGGSRMTEKFFCHTHGSTIDCH